MSWNDATPTGHADRPNAAPLVTLEPLKSAAPTRYRERP
jgi:hypothetical protein